ncbi:hypothetical protein GCM10027049_25000 [Mucilaginibacter puniceus]
MKRIWGLVITLGAIMLLFQSCYTLKSTSIPPELKTISVPFFENNSALVVSYLSQDFTEALKERVRTTTRLSIVTGQGDASMSGAITDYRYAPISIQATGNNQAPIAGASVLSISVHVKFDYPADNKLSFDQTFTKTQNYTGDLSTQEKALTQVIIRQLIDEIFNTAFNNW